MDNLKPIRNKLAILKAKHVKTLQQTDVYFDIPKGRLKLRQINNEKTQLIYYERENTSKPKRSDVFIIEIPKNVTFMALLKRILEVKATVKKTREIYWHQRTQIHLDTVDSLGDYVELEKTLKNPKELEESVKLLEKLRKTLKINSENLERLSYGDLVNLK